MHLYGPAEHTHADPLHWATRRDLQRLYGALTSHLTADSRHARTYRSRLDTGFSERVLCIWTIKMVRSLSQWTKTLSFPARLSPNRTSKESVVNVQPGSPGVSPTPSASSLPQGSDKTITPIPITEISQIVSPLFYWGGSPRGNPWEIL